MASNKVFVLFVQAARLKMSVQIILPAFLLKGKKKKKGSIPLVKGTCVAFLQLCFVLFCFLTQHFYFSVIWHFISCMFTGGK